MSCYCVLPPLGLPCGSIAFLSFTQSLLLVCSRRTYRSIPVKDETQSSRQQRLEHTFVIFMHGKGQPRLLKLYS